MVNTKRDGITSPYSRPALSSSGVVYKGILVKSVLPHITQQIIEAICDAPKFKGWIDSFDLDAIDFKEFTVTDVDFFGPAIPSRLGFVKGYGQAFDKKTGEAIPAIVFLRGSSVAVFMVVRVRETGKKYILLCQQLRFPAGRMLTEACAGMLDDKTENVIGVVFKEVQEETGFNIVRSELIELGEIRPSGGGCDETIHLFAWETEISELEYEDKRRQVFGTGEHEKIKLGFYDYDTFDETLDIIGDVKAECAWRRYQRHLIKSSTP